ncbi:MAG TPA: ABC transporter substrate-binding protein, partial [Pseudomonas sp.]|nr:ABC transporter substrate-binding protein [Pseudomonas sp.]
TLGYHYSNKLTDAFESGQLTRHDVRDLNTRLKMLERHRLDATVELRRPLQHYLL